MPSSRPNTIPTVIHLLRQLKPQSILDVGVGFGKWGHLFREYTDILEAEHDPARYRREKWQVRIDGIEGHAAYLTDMHRFLYNDIHVGDASVLMKALPNYDLIFLGDIIEHFEMAVGMELLRDARSRANKAVIVSTPKFETEQEDLCGNELERHRSLWSEEDFRRFPDAIVATVDAATLLAVLPKSGDLKLRLTPPPSLSEHELARQRSTREELISLIPVAENWILVDDESLRSTLPHSHVRPFLEKDGRYWGPPANDAEALAEVERMRQEGARFLVFVSATFWWLQHYAGFVRELRGRFSCVRENDVVVIFDLRNLQALPD